MVDSELTYVRYVRLARATARHRLLVCRYRKPFSIMSSKWFMADIGEVERCSIGIIHVERQHDRPPNDERTVIVPIPNISIIRWSAAIFCMALAMLVREEVLVLTTLLKDQGNVKFDTEQKFKDFLA